MGFRNNYFTNNPHVAEAPAPELKPVDVFTLARIHANAQASKPMAKPAPKRVALNTREFLGMLNVKFEVNGKVTNYRKNAQRTSAEQRTFDEVKDAIRYFGGIYMGDDERWWKLSMTQEFKGIEHQVIHHDVSDDNPFFEWDEVKDVKVNKQVPTIDELTKRLEGMGYTVTVRKI